jgi:SAM-dependent methyltransferase
MLKTIYRKIKETFYPCYCPICVGYFNNWLETGVDSEVLTKYQVVGGGRRLSACPNCSSVDRMRMLYSYLIQNTTIFNENTKSRILHVAPERQLKEKFLQVKGLDYIPCDKFVFGNGVIEVDITAIPFPTNHFDYIICNHVLEHVAEDEKAMSEILRFLDKGGLAILQIPYSLEISQSLEDNTIITPEEKLKVFGQEDHVRLYALDDYVLKLRNVGFGVQLMNPFSAKWTKSPTKMGLNPKEYLILCTKQ